MGRDDDTANALLIWVERKTLPHQRRILLLLLQAHCLRCLILPGLFIHQLISVVSIFQLLVQTCRHFRMVLPGLILRLLGVLRGGVCEVLHDFVRLALCPILSEGMPRKPDHYRTDHRGTDLPRQRQRVHTHPWTTVRQSLAQPGANAPQRNGDLFTARR